MEIACGALNNASGELFATKNPSNLSRRIVGRCRLITEAKLASYGIISSTIGGVTATTRGASEPGKTLGEGSK